jgi:hypothetical protein
VPKSVQQSRAKVAHGLFVPRLLLDAPMHSPGRHSTANQLAQIVCRETSASTKTVAGDCPFA